MVDRRTPLLPWLAEDGLEKISPFDAAVEIVKMLRAAAHAALPSDVEKEALPLVLTVPASFEESARTLTYEAALAAGFENVMLLEEPLAAVYAWFAQHGSEWRKHLTPGDLICVCDVGGGTSDFSLIAVEDTDGVVSFRRVSVGEHILLGGDNMDLALAHVLRQRLEDQGKTIDPWQFLTLVQGARLAKESLLGSTKENDIFPIAVPTRGGSLFAGTLSVGVERSEAERIILDGFFPLVSSDETPRARRGVALKEFGLPYATDAAITRHLAGFLAISARNAAQETELAKFLKDGKLIPTKILFNGGVFESQAFRDRMIEQLAAWNHGVRPEVLINADVDTAVARGAAYYGGVVAQGGGLRIRAGLSRSYYVGLEPTELAVPGITLRTKGLCVAPRGLEEGSECDLTGQEFVLSAGQEVEFKLYNSNERPADTVGAVVPDADRDLVDGGSVRVTIDSAEPLIPVTLSSRVTEVGTLELSVRDTRSNHSWRLEFDVRSNLD